MKKHMLHARRGCLCWKRAIQKRVDGHLELAAMAPANMLFQENAGDSMRGLTAKTWSGVQSKPENEEYR